MDDEVVVTYVGDGDFITGIPRRDITASEWQALTQAQRDAVLDSKIYAKTAVKVTAVSRKKRGK